MERLVIQLAGAVQLPELLKQHREVHAHLAGLTADTLASLRVIQTRGLSVITRAVAPETKEEESGMDKLTKLVNLAAQVAAGEAPEDTEPG